ncbi:MAG: glutamate racemase [Acidimicrobiia bacterium]
MIGVFDSGVGGLSVLSEIRGLMPNSDLLYLADRARAPYGNRTLDDVRQISMGIGEWLIEQGASTLVVACNTASAAALETLRARFPGLPVVGMEPAIKPAAARTSSGVIAVFATTATFQGRLFESVVSRHGAGVRVVARACPEWVELVEAGLVDGEVVQRTLQAPLNEAIGAGADVAVLGCTHFSFLAPAMAAIGGEALTVIDPAPAVAAQTARVATEPDGEGMLRLAASGDPARLVSLAASLAGITTPHPVLKVP